MKKTSSLLERDDDFVRSPGSFCRQKLAPFQDKLSCPICKEFFTLPVTLVRCGHTFCGKCLNDYVRTFQDDKKRKCPRCKGPVTHESDWDNTGEVAVKPNELVEEIVESWKKVFADVDKNGNQFVTVGELVASGLLSQKVSEAVARIIDPDDETGFGREAFLSAMTRMHEKRRPSHFTFFNHVG